MGIGRSTLAEPVVARFPTAVGQQPSPRMTLWEDVGSSVEHGGGHHWLWRASLRVNSWSRGPENPTFTHLPLSALRPRGPSSPGVVSRTGPGALSGPVSGPMGIPGCWRGRTRPPTYQGTPTTHPALRARKQTPRPRGDTAQPGQGVCAMACASTRSTGKNAYGSSAVTPRLMLGEAFLSLQQPMHHQQLAHQVVEVWLAVRQFGSMTALVRSAWACSDSSGVIRRGSAMFLAPSLDSSGAAAGSWLRTSTTSMGPKAARSRRRVGNWSSSTSGIQPSCRCHGPRSGRRPGRVTRNSIHL